MESCLAVEREIDKVLSKFGTLNEHTQTTLSDLIAQGQEMYRELGEVPADADVTTSHGIALTQCAQKMKDLSSSLATEHRDLHGTVSKVGKAIDKNFVPDFWATSNEDVFDRSDKKKALNQVIVEHLLRQGMLDIAEELSREARLESAQKEPFAELNNVLDALKRRDLGPALDWVEQHELQGTALHFQLHRLHLVGLLQRAAAAEAIVYARAHLAPLARQHERDLQVLMGSCGCPAAYRGRRTPFCSSRRSGATRAKRSRAMPARFLACRCAARWRYASRQAAWPCLRCSTSSK